MESSDDLGEECSSSESGWTMYIASPMHENINDDDENDDDDNGYDGYGDGDEKKKLKNEADYGGDRKEEEGSDDSMASDASSGPSQHQKVLRDLKNAKGIQQRKSSGKSPQKKAEKSKCNRKLKPEKDFARNGGKARKPQ